MGSKRIYGEMGKKDSEKEMKLTLFLSSSWLGIYFFDVSQNGTGWGLVSKMKTIHSPNRNNLFAAVSREYFILNSSPKSLAGFACFKLQAGAQ